MWPWRVELNESLTTVNSTRWGNDRHFFPGEFSVFSETPSAFTHQQFGDTGCSFSWRVGILYKDFRTKALNFCSFFYLIDTQNHPLECFWVAIQISVVIHGREILIFSSPVNSSEREKPSRILSNTQFILLGLEMDEDWSQSLFWQAAFSQIRWVDWTVKL